MPPQFPEPDAKLRLASGDAATRALSVTPVETDFVEEVYEDISSWYDWWFGPTLHAGRLESIGRAIASIQKQEQRRAKKAARPKRK